MARQGGIVGRLQEATGLTIERTDRLEVLEAAQRNERMLRRNLEELAYTALDYAGQRPQELKFEERRTLAQKSWVVWMQDPQAGAAVDLRNDFVFGRGVSKPRAKDAKVQEVIDEAWDDPDNQRILTTHAAQLALGVDLAIQSNLFFLLFDDGEDGKVKVSLLPFDHVQDVVASPDDAYCPLWYVAYEEREEWDFDADGPKREITKTADGKKKVVYYEHWANVQHAIDEAKAAGEPPPPGPAESKVKPGKVLHLAENRGTRMRFGHPRMDRTLRWFTAYNRFLSARVDMMTAAAAFVMKRKITGSETRLKNLAQQALTRRTDLGVDRDPEGIVVPGPPRGASILNENDTVSHEPFALNTNAGNAVMDAQSIRSQISAATRWPASYYGDASQSNLATATSLELPVLKHVEMWSELFEQVFRWFTDRAIDRAVEKGILDPELSDDEIAELQARKGTAAEGDDRPSAEVGQDQGTQDLSAAAKAKDDGEDEIPEERKRDLSYEFSMPNPLRRALADIVTSVMNIARTFDPNNTNVELSRVLLAEALTALEVQDVAAVVEEVFPPGYVDPAVAAAQQQAAGGQMQLIPGDGSNPQDFGPFGPQSPGADGQQHSQDNPYGAPMAASAPDQMTEAWNVPAASRVRLRQRGEGIEEAFAPVDDLVDTLLDSLNRRGNGNGNGA